jgi:hypothetical protein
MASANLFARTLARRSLEKALRLNSVAPLKNVRFASTYFTPGEQLFLHHFTRHSLQPAAWIEASQVD